MRTQLSRPSRAFRSGEVIVRFLVRMIVLIGFAAIAGIGFAPGLAMLLWMSTILSAGIATFKRELPLSDALNHWDEAVAYIALCCLIQSLSHAAA
ncbi:MAG TPA: hypothetical protein VKY22_16240 [Bradyrhizobium sp.]|nr:hypothetical protein [Bradyrhizobium sp.]